MRHLRPIVATMLGLGLSVAAAGTALAKGEHTRLTLDNPLPVDAPPGSEVEIAWTLGGMEGKGTTSPFSAEGVYIRLTPASGQPVEVVARQDRPGHYVAAVTVPPGGLGAVAIGLRGTACLANDECTRADEIFMTAIAGSRGSILPADPVANAPADPVVAPPAAPTPAAQTPGAIDPALLILVALGALGVVAAGAIAARSRGGATAA